MDLSNLMSLPLSPAEPACPALLPALPPLHPRAQAEDDFGRGMYLLKTSGCSVCPGADDGECAKCEKGSGRCIECYDPKTYKPEGGFNCIKK